MSESGGGIIVNPGTPQLWVDRVGLTVRSDRLATLSMQTLIPSSEQLVEVARFQLTVEHLGRIRDIVSEALEQADGETGNE